MTDPKEPAFAANTGGESMFGSEGLTKRELFAAMAMQGLADQYPIFDGEIGTSQRAAINSLAKDSVKLADALVAALNKEAKR